MVPSQLLSCLSLAIIGCVVYGVHGQSPRECAPWTRLAGGINQNRQGKGVHIGCKDHSGDKCEQLDCGGRYVMDFVSTELDFDVCLGLIFHHCNSPPAMEIKLQLPTLNSTVHKFVTHNDSIPVPGLRRQFGRNLAEVVIFVELQKRNETSFSLRMTGRVRFTTTVFGRQITEWPEDLQRDIITIDNIPVSHCSVQTHETLTGLASCDITKYIGTTSSSPTTVQPPTTVVPIVIKSRTYNTSCVQGSMKQSHCGFGEACIYGRCLCAYDYKLSYRGVCNFTGTKRPGPILYIPKSVIGNPDGPLQPASQTQPAPSGHKTAYIIGGSVGGIVLLAAIVIVVVVVIRKRGSRYQGRELLLTEDDTDGAM